MRLIAVLGVFAGIPAMFILAHIDNRIEENVMPHAVVSIPRYAEEHVERCFFWVTEDEKMTIPLADPPHKK